MAKEEENEGFSASVEIPQGPESGELSASWEDLKKALQIPRLPVEDLRKFVDDFVSNRIFTTAHLSDGQKDMLPMVFLPIALGAFREVQPDSLKQIGVIYEFYDKAGSRAINGLPIFTSLRVLHTDDWDRARVAITREQERRKNIEL